MEAELAEARKGLEAAAGEMKVLKRAVCMQDDRIKKGQAELAALRSQNAELAQHGRRLEVENYALKVHLQEAEVGAGAGSMFQPPRNPDVF